MLNQYAWWKYLVLGIVILLGFIFAAPNLFGENPSVQISPDRASVPMDEDLLKRVLTQLEADGLLEQAQGHELTPDRVAGPLHRRRVATQSAGRVKYAVGSGLYRRTKPRTGNARLYAQPGLSPDV